MDWKHYEREGWSWAVGSNPNYGGYYARVWKDLPKPVRIDGHLRFRECYIAGGKTIAEAEAKLQDRLSRTL